MGLLDAPGYSRAQADARFVTTSSLALFNVKAQYGAKGDGTTDDTTAIQDAINAAVTAGGGVVYFPAGTYYLAGPLQDTSGSNAILLLPTIAPTAAAPITIEFRGPYAVPTAYPEGNSTPVPVNGVILLQGTTPSGGTPSVIGGPQSTEAWSDITFVMRNITVRCANNPQFCAIQLSHVANCVLENVVCDVSAAITSGITLPTTSSAVGILAPATANYGLVRFNNVYVVGYYRGIQISEHATLDAVFIQCCVQGINLQSGHHLNSFMRVLIQWCKTAILGGSASNYIQGFLDIEDANGGTWAPTAHVSDASSFIIGELFVNRVIQTAGNTAAALTVTGGTKLALNILGQKTPITLTGTTAGTAVSKMGSSSGQKQFLVYLNGYQNAGTTAQTITIPTPYTFAPLVLSQPASFGATCTTTTLTLPTSMGAPVTGWIIVEGF